MKKSLTIVLFMVSMLVMGQESDSVKLAGNKIRWIHTVNLGYLFEGNNSQVDGRFTGEVMSGIQYGMFGAAVGFGVDEYDVHTVMPFFLQLNVDMKKGSTIPYYYAKAGFTKAWGKEEYFSGSETKGGRLLAAGVGVRRNLKSIGFNLSVGYQSQRLSTTTAGGQYWDIIGPWGGGTSTTLKRTMNRVVVKIGIMF